MDFELGNVKALTADVIRQMGEEMDDFAFAGGRAADENDYVKGVFGHIENVGVG